MSTHVRGGGARVLVPLAYYEGADAARLLKDIGVDRYAFDTEFASSSSYFPRLALVQVATTNAIAIIDPLNQDPLVLTPLLTSGATMVAHAASNDLSILRHAGLSLPHAVLDTQVAAQFLGHRILSLADLVEWVLGVSLDKTHQRRDWTKRPLPRAALEYAASDVRYLLAVAEVVEEALRVQSKVAWWYEESALALVAPPEESYVIIPPRSSKVLTQNKAAIMAWRESVARARDIPRRWVVDDATVFVWAKALPNEFPMLSEPEVCELRAALERAPSIPTHRQLRRTRAQKDALVRLRVARDALAVELRVDAPLLATAKDLEKLVDAQSTRLERGWRREHVLGPLSAVLGATHGARPNIARIVAP